MFDIKTILDKEVIRRNTVFELDKEKPDPLIVAHIYRDEYISLICALFAYGKASLIVKFLSSLDFSFLDKSEQEIKKMDHKFYYRFQNHEDVVQFFITLKRAKDDFSLEKIFLKGYKNRNNVIEGLREIILFLYDINNYRSRGYEFLIGKVPDKNIKSTYKRWNMYLRWMVRKDSLDMGLWSQVDKKDLLMPLDTHTFNISKKLGLLKRKSYDFKAVLELTETLKKFDRSDPIKYDFAIYRIGQENLIF